MIQTRNLEIDLFWKRSLFFGGFISAAFVGYAALRQSELRTVLACFGTACSCAWTLVNRGSKYWQENWEAKVEHFELPVTGVLFAKEEDPQFHKGRWRRGRAYSVSRIAIALSDYVLLLWLGVVLGEAVCRYTPSSVQPWLKKTGTEVFVIFSLLYVVLMLVYCRRTPRPVWHKG